MKKTEIKELFEEEKALFRRIRSYVTRQPQKSSDRVENVTLLLLYRISSNLYSALYLTAVAEKNSNFSFFQLPIGIILRCAFTDCLLALYLQRIDTDKACEELDLRTIEYANSLFERREVYRDQIKSIAIDFDDEFIDNLWELTMEDNFLHLLTFDENKEGLAVTKQSKNQLNNAGYSKSKSIKTKELIDFLIGQEGLCEVVTQLYNYYKYFSQYEHFSENGQGDVLASSNEDGNDNIHFPSAIRALCAGVEAVISPN